MKFTHQLESFGFALLLAFPLFLTACDTDEGQSGTQEVAVSDLQDASPEAWRQIPADTGMLRLVHLGVFPNDENTTVDVFVDGEKTDIELSFKQGTDYVDLPVGKHTLDIVPSGGDIADSVLNISDFEVAAGDMWSMIAAGYVAEDQDQGARFTGLAFPEDASDIPAGMTRLNVFHTAALAALTPLDIWLVDEDCKPVEALIRDFEFGQVAEKVDVPTASIMIGFDVGQDATVDACFEIPELEPDIMVNAYAVNNDRRDVSILAHLPDGSIVELEPK